MGNKTYFEKLKDPRWQKMRLEIFERDQWECRYCKSKTQTLVVHHTYYLPGREPWEYEEQDLITLCIECHESDRNDRGDEEKDLLYLLRQHYSATDLSYLHFYFCIHGADKLIEEGMQALTEATTSPKKV